MAMYLTQELRMNGGNGDTSYAQASYIPKQVLLSTKSIREQAIEEFYLKNLPSTLCIADLGCSSGNTMTVILELVETVEKARQKLGLKRHHYQVCLNDLPNNDFNTVFRSLQKFHDMLTHKFGNDVGHCFVSGVPGSFYGRLFPDNSLHFVHSSYSTHWLSQVPYGVEENKKNIYITKTSPTSVIRAYYQQFEKDFSKFLSCRSEEVIVGGKMVLTIIGRKSNEAFSRECSHMWDLLATVFAEMASEGLIDEEKLDTFNIPNYYPSLSELKKLIEGEGSFHIDRFHTFETTWVNINKPKDLNSYDFVTCMRSVFETLLINHFGDELIDELFTRYHKVVQSSVMKEDTVYVNHLMVLTKKLLDVDESHIL